MPGAQRLVVEPQRVASRIEPAGSGISDRERHGSRRRLHELADARGRLARTDAELVAGRARRLLYLRGRHGDWVRRAARSDRVQARRHGGKRALGCVWNRISRAGGFARHRRGDGVGAGSGESLSVGTALMRTVDLSQTSVRELNATLHLLRADTNQTQWRVLNPRGRHAIAAGIDAPITVEIEGHAGYYCAGMNKEATIVLNGNAGQGIGENMMSGRVHVKGDASQAAGATGCGGVLVVGGNASARGGVSMKGIDIVVKGSVGHLSAFMGQAGNLVVLGDAGEALGDSIYEARLFVRGSVSSLGADCVEKPLEERHKVELAELLNAAGLNGTVDPGSFRRYGSARKLYHFHIANVGSY